MLCVEEKEVKRLFSAVMYSIHTQKLFHLHCEGDGQRGFGLRPSYPVKRTSEWAEGP